MQKLDEPALYPQRRNLDKENSLTIEKLSEMAERVQYCKKTDKIILSGESLLARRLPGSPCKIGESDDIELLRLGLQAGLFDKRKDEDGWPAYIWAVHHGAVYEAVHQGGVFYSGYFLPPTDPFYDEVKNFWRLRNA